MQMDAIVLVGGHGQISDRSAGGSVFGVDFGVREMSEV